MSPFPSLVFVCPSNCGSATFILTIAVNPSRKSSPDRVNFSFFFDLIKLFLEAWLFIALVRAERKPERWVPPSIVLMLFTNVNILSLYVFPYLKATSTGTSPVSFLTVMTLLCSGLLCSSKYFTKSLSPPLNLKELFSPSSVLSSDKTISNPLFK